MSQKFHRASNHWTPRHRSAQNSRRRGRQGPSGSIHSQHPWSTQLQPSHNRQISPTHRCDDSRFKALLLNRVIKDLQSLNTMTGYQDLARSLHPSLHIQLNDSWIQTELQRLYRQKREEVQNAVNIASNIVLSAELWSLNDKMYYLTVSCHLISENWIRESYVIDTAHLLHDHTADNILQQLLRISNEWKITEKIRVVVTNVGSMKKVSTSGCRWTFIPCLADTLDKVFRETIDKTKLNDLLKKCQHIVAYFHQNIKASERLQEHCSDLKLRRTELIQITDLKWLPTLHMLKSILALWPAIFKVSIDFLNEVSLNENERKILNDILAVLRILKEVTEEIGSHGYRPISNLLPLVQKLQEKLRNQFTGNQIAQRFCENCYRHTNEIKQNHWFRVSTALDPRYKTLNFDSETDVKTEIRSQMRGRTHSHDAGNEELILEKYWQSGNTSEDPFQFWRTTVEFKQLATVARKYLTIVSTAIPMERVHQLEKIQIMNRRSSLEPKHLNMILFLNAN